MKKGLFFLSVAFIATSLLNTVSAQNYEKGALLFGKDSTVTAVQAVGEKGILGDAARTVEAWIKVDTAGGEGLAGHIVDWGKLGKTTRSTMRLNKTSLRFEAQGAGFGTKFIGKEDVLDGKWHHVAVTYAQGAVWDTTDLSIFMYIDGVKQYISATPNTAVSDTKDSVDLTIGCNPHPFANLRAFSGLIDEVRIWSVALSEAEINANKDTELDPTQHATLVNYYRFNEGKGTTTKDYGINAKDATIGGPSFNDTLDVQSPEWVADGAPITALVVSSVSTDILSNTKVSVYPNPSAGSTSVKVNLVQPGVVSVKLVNMVGQTVKDIVKSQTLSGAQTFELNTADYAAGVYNVLVSVDGNLKAEKLIVQ